MEATYQFDAPIERVWALMMDTSAVGSCLPGCRGLEPDGEDRYRVQLGVAVAAISGDFKGTIALEEKIPPTSYRLVVEGTGRQGFVKGSARVTLAEDSGRTLVRVNAHADVGGIIARVGQRLLESVAKATMDRFYACMAGRVAST